MKQQFLPCFPSGHRLHHRFVYWRAEDSKRSLSKGAHAQWVGRP